MGCGSSQSTEVIERSIENANGSTVKDDSNGTNGNHQETPKKYPPPTAFVIPLEDSGDNDADIIGVGGGGDSLIKKHPPKRLKRLEEIPSTPPSIEDLEEKLANAEIRRQQILQQKISTVTKQRENTESKETENSDENDNEKLNKENESNNADDDGGSDGVCGGVDGDENNENKSDS